MVVKIVTTLTPVFGIIFLGFLFARRNIIPMTATAGLNQFVYWIGMPAMMFNILVRFNSDGVASGFIPAVYVALLCNYFATAAMAVWFFRASKAEAVMLSYMANFPNGVFMGVAVISFLLPGDDFAVQIAGLCAFLYAIVMPFSDTVLEMLRHKGESLPKLALSLGLTLIRNPMVIGGCLGITLNATGVAVPEWLRNMAAMLGGTAAPCALFSMGMVMNAQLASLGTGPASSLNRQLATHAFKLAVMPGLTFLCLRLTGIQGVPLGVATLLAAMPVGVVAYVIAEKYQVCVRESSMIIFVDTVASIATIPLIISVLYALGVFVL